MSITSLTSANDIDTLDISALTSGVQKVTNSASTALSTISRSTPTSITKTAASTNAFTTHNYLSTISDIDYTDQNLTFATVDQSNLDKLTEISGIEITDQDSFELAQSTASSTIMSQVKEALGITSFNPFSEESSSDSSVDLSSLSKQFDSMTDGGLSFGEGVSYLEDDLPTITDMEGNLIDGIPSDLDFSTFSDIAKLSNKICGTGLLSYLNYSNGKNIFNMLLGAVLDSGVASFLSSLLKCAVYAGSSSNTMALNYVSTAAKKGDIDTFTALTNHLGYTNIPNYNASLLSLKSAMPNSSSNISKYQALLASSGKTSSSLYTTTPSYYTNGSTRYTNGTSMYNANSWTARHNFNPYTEESYLANEKRNNEALTSTLLTSLIALH